MNTILMKDGDDSFYISYNPFTDCGEETALCVKINDGGLRDIDFFILLGDYRKEYQEVLNDGKDACLKKYQQLLDSGAEKSFWSN